MAKGNSPIGIVIQARYSATRLPGKLFLPFHNSKSILDIILAKFKATINNKYKIVIATTTNKQDDKFINIAQNYNYELFRGSENDVLQRTIDAAEAYGFLNIVRVCADNPIYDINRTLDLIPIHIQNNNDYTAYKLKGNLPAIKSHLGFWGEVVSLSALKRVSLLTNEKFYHEHVTNFIYGYPDEFNVSLLEAPNFVFDRNDIRLTVDTKEDFEMMQDIYINLVKLNSDFSVKEIINFLDQNRHYLKLMHEQIERNKK